MFRKTGAHHQYGLTKLYFYRGYFWFYACTEHIIKLFNHVDKKKLFCRWQSFDDLRSGRDDTGRRKKNPARCGIFLFMDFMLFSDHFKGYFLFYFLVKVECDQVFTDFLDLRIEYDPFTINLKTFLLQGI